jgi:DNA polymerase elongation subunit (family B)
MLQQIPLEKILFLDIETVPQYRCYEDVPKRLQNLWDVKAKLLAKNDEDPEEMYPRAGIYAEFGKIICISLGYIHHEEIRLKSFYDHNEKELLRGFKSLVDEHFNNANQLLCAHNGKEFDFPYIARRMLISGIQLPRMLDIAGKKPWEIPHLDTMELWKFGDFKNYTSLSLLTAVFDIPTPKDDIDGSMVAEVYYEDKNCQKDVVALIQLMRRYRGEELIENVLIIET